MFSIYSKVGHDSYLVYDDSDCSLDTCSVEDIKGYLAMEIKIKGALISGKSMKLGISPPRDLHLVQGVHVGDMLLSTAVCSFLLKYSENVYTVCKGKTPIAVLNINLEYGMIMGGGFIPLVRSKVDIRNVFKFLLDKYKINGLSAVTENYAITPLESIGADFEFMLEEQRQHALDNKGEYLFTITGDSLK